MNKIICFLFFITVTVLGLRAQDYSDEQIARRMIYGEIAGPTLGFSVNYDARFSTHSPYGLGYRLGLGFGVYDEMVDLTSKNKQYLAIPLGLNYVFGTSFSPHTLELGVGATILSKKLNVYDSHPVDYLDNTGGNIIQYATIMYRLQPYDRGFTWRIGFTPILGTESDLILMGAIGLGYAF